MSSPVLAARESISRPGSAGQFPSRSVHRACKLNVLHRQAISVVRRKQNLDRFVDIRPFGVVVHALGHQSHLGHEPEGFHEIAENKCLGQRITGRLTLPSHQRTQDLLPLRLIEFCCHKPLPFCPKPSLSSPQQDSSDEADMSNEAIYDLTAPTLDDFEQLANDIYDRLPSAFRKRCGQLLFRIEDLPDEDVSAELELESPYDILGLFQGVDLTEQQESDPPLEPNIVFLYRRPILDEWADSEITLGDIVAHVIVHEIGHHFGLSDDDMERIEAEISEG